MLSLNVIKKIEKVLDRFYVSEKEYLNAFVEDAEIAEALCKELNEKGNFEKIWTVTKGHTRLMYNYNKEDSLPIYSYEHDDYEMYFLIHCHGNKYTVTLENHKRKRL